MVLDLFSGKKKKKKLTKWSKNKSPNPRIMEK